MENISSAELTKIEEVARKFYCDLDFAHDQSHGERVVANALLLNKLVGGDRSLIKAGAWLHQYHDDLELLKFELNNLCLLAQVKELLYEIVRDCRPNKISANSSLEAKIVFDADALDLVGPFGTVREILCNFSHRGLDWEQTVSSCRSVQKLFFDKLMLNETKEIAKQLFEANELFWKLYDQEKLR